MAGPDVAFYTLSAIAILSALFVVFSRHAVHAVLWLILTFIAAAGLFILLGAEFLAMLLLVVYIGAVAVLFLFVVMMLDVELAALRAKFAPSFPIALGVGIILLIELWLVGIAWQSAQSAHQMIGAPIPDLAQVENTRALGRILYDDFFVPFQLAGLILLVAMIGAIVLAMRRREGVKRQAALQQVLRDPGQAVELRDVKPGSSL